MSYILLLFFGALSILSCQSEKDQLSVCETTCDDEVISDRLGDVPAKVIINNTYTSAEGKTFAVHAITINPADLDNQDWTVDPDFILAPCNLPDRLKKDNLAVVISGNRKSCCNQLTQPNFRTAYGCKFEITDIRAE